MTYRSLSAPTRFAELDDARLAYRRFGEGGVPLILLQRYQGTLDDWDPDFLERLSDSREVVIFDYPGIGSSTGAVRADFTAFAALTVAFAAAIGIDRADLLGWSFSNFTASHLALLHPGFVRRLILAAASAGYLENGPPTPVTGARIGTTDGTHDDDYAWLFFSHTPEGAVAAAAHLARLRLRPGFFVGALDAAALAGQLAARAILMTPDGSLMNRFGEIPHPTLVLHGMQDVRMPVLNGFRSAQEIPNARFIGYPAANHGFLFEYAAQVAADVDAFLA